MEPQHYGMDLIFPYSMFSSKPRSKSNRSLKEGLLVCNLTMREFYTHLSIFLDFAVKGETGFR